MPSPWARAGGVPKNSRVVPPLDMRKQTLKPVRRIACSIEVLELAALPDLLADAVDDRVHRFHGQPEDEDFGCKGVMQADGVGEAWSFLVRLDPDDVPAMLLNISKQLPVAVILGGRRTVAALVYPLVSCFHPGIA